MSASASSSLLRILKLLTSSSSEENDASAENNNESKSIADRIKITHQEEFGVEWMQWDKSTYRFSEPDADMILPVWIKRTDDKLIVTLDSENIELNDVSSMEKLVANIYKIHNLLKKQLKSASDVQHVLNRYDVSWFINNIPIPKQLIYAGNTQQYLQECCFAPLCGDDSGDNIELPDFLEPVKNRLSMSVNITKLMSHFPHIKNYEQNINQTIIESGSLKFQFSFGCGRWNQVLWLLLKKMLRSIAEKQSDYPLEHLDAFFNLFNGQKINTMLQRFREHQIITSTRRWVQKVYKPMLSEIYENTFTYGQQSHADLIAPALDEIELNHRHLFYSRSPDAMKLVRELEDEFDRGVAVLSKVREE